MRTLLTAVALLGLWAACVPECARAALKAKSIVRVAQATRARKPKVNPGAPSRSALERFRRMTPQQRRKALGKLDPVRRRAIEQRLRQLDNLTPEQQRKLRQEYQLFRQMPAARQAEARRLYQQFNQLPDQRRSAMTLEFRRLRRLTPAARTERMAGKQFEKRFSADEQKLLREMVKTLPEQSSGK